VLSHSSTAPFSAMAQSAPTSLDGHLDLKRSEDNDRQRRF